LDISVAGNGRAEPEAGTRYRDRRLLGDSL